MHTIILSRHAEKQSDDNNYTFVPDPSITEKGERQCLEVKEFIRDIKLDATFSSIYRRAIDTSNFIYGDRRLPLIMNACFNEYYVRSSDEANLETTSMGASRTMSYLYSIFSLYNNISIVAHKSINRTIIQSLLNLDWEESQKLFENNAETHILRYDHALGDTKWRIVNSIIPQQ
jgi:broad specificity phosphatase PhoE